MFFPERIRSIQKIDRVLEIGPGNLPHLRANVLLERALMKKKLLSREAELEN